MITEDYVSFETAKLLKEKGFDEYTGRCFVGEEWESSSPLTNSQLPDGRYSRPTLQMVMKWLREIHDIDIMIWVENRSGVKQYTSDCWKNVLQWLIDNTNYHRSRRFSSYEEACEAAIKYCLENLI